MSTPLRVAFVTGSTPDKWARRWRDRSRVRLELIPVSDVEQHTALRDGTADMLLARLPLNDSDDLHIIRLYEEAPVVVVGIEHPAAAYDELPWEDLVEEQFPLGVPAGLAVTAEQLAWPAMSIKDAVEVTASGTGVVILPMAVARLHARKDTRQIPLIGPEPTQIVLAWPRDEDRAITQEFVGVVKGRTSRSSR